ncbi:MULTISPECIES: hypothetical protein [unclassified Lactococcus]|uniref:hypothetical protein n=1 Tax=unclassified Lactococcus TaxID=2643510 RepID=UPI0011C8E8C5|nr:MULTISPECIES: hypothetical protein [unclassified Lactococcus]MQW23828.1 hypothetical protein [Lactococcus sp. dk101]TXK37347.1 hypothetical protein FVP42_08965 [Lactococcus sp. dk310]TXK48659.1 hypothetical protein FVP43_08940 [Lactococcus sp. dk322]
MEIVDYLAKRVKIVSIENKIWIGRVSDYTTSADNDDEGEYICITPESGKLQGQPVVFYPNEIKKIELI